MIVVVPRRLTHAAAVSVATTITTTTTTVIIIIIIILIIIICPFFISGKIVGYSELLNAFFLCVITGLGDYDNIKCVECILGTHSSADWFPPSRRVSVCVRCVLYVRYSLHTDNNAYHAIPIIRIYRGAYGRRESCARELTDRK